MAVKASNKNFVITLCENKRLPEELDWEEILKILLGATEVLKEDYLQFVEEFIDLDYKEDFIAKMEDDIFLWFHTHPAFQFLTRFLDEDTQTYFQQIESCIPNLEDRYNKKYDSEEIQNLSIRLYELKHHRKFFELFPSSSFSVRSGPRNNTFIITWTLKNFYHHEQISFLLEMNTEQNLKDMAGVSFLQNMKSEKLPTDLFLPQTLLQHLQNLHLSHKCFNRLL